ncbi:TerD family protein [Gordonia polyisoprenivorans]|nr:TerD family protein [Gordonia polyisoprenivorans]
MSLGFRVGVPGMRVRVSTRGVRASVGPRIARVHVGSGRTRVSTGMGPFFASTALSSGRSGSRRRTTTTRRGGTRYTGPSPAQLARAQRAAERAQQQAERDAAIERLRQLHHDTTTAHLQQFPTASRPMLPPPPAISTDVVRAQAMTLYLNGIGRFARSARERARADAELAARMYCDSESQRLNQLHAQLSAEADRWWQALCANEETTVCEAVNAAFADNPAAGCAVGVDGSALSIIMRLQDLDTLPTQMPALTPAGRPTLKTMAKRDRMRWWMHILVSNLAATVSEALATAPSITAVNAAVITRMPDTARLGLIAYGSWSRDEVERVSWRTADDAWRLLDIGTDVRCGIKATASGNISSSVTSLPLDGLPGVATLLDNCEVDDDSVLGDLDADLQGGQSPADPADSTPYTLAPFGEWLQEQLARPQPDRTNASPTADPLPPTGPSPAGGRPEPEPHAYTMSAGESIVLPDAAHAEIRVEFTTAGGAADLGLLLLDAHERVVDDDAFIFYNQPCSADGSVRLTGKSHNGSGSREGAVVYPGALDPRIVKVLICATADVDTGETFDSIAPTTLSVAANENRWVFTPRQEPGIRALVLGEIYLRGRPAGTEWKLRALGQGWREGLAALVRAYGVSVDE